MKKAQSNQSASTQQTAPIIPKKAIATIACALFVLTLVAAGGTVVAKTSMPLSVKLASKTKRVSVTKPLSLQLNQTIQKINTAKIRITPSVQGSWSTETGSLIKTNRLIFTPSKALKTNTAYTIELPKADRLLIGTTAAQKITFHTEKAPGLAKTGLAQLQQNSVLPADYVFTAELESKNNQLRNLDLRISPNIELSESNEDHTTYSWKPTQLLPQGKKLTVELYDTQNSQTMFKQTVTVAAMPRMISTVHRTDATPNSPIDFTFSEDMMQKNDILTIDKKPVGSWLNPRTYRFVPKTLIEGKSYNYTFASGLRSVKGGIHTQPINGTITARGAVALVSSAPHGSELSQASQTIVFRFNQPIDPNTAKKSFSISAGTVTSLVASGNTLTANVKNLGFQRTITANVQAGVKNAAFGLPSTTSYSLSFTTEYRVKRLAVPHYRQEHSATCAVASVRMALAYYGVSTGEMNIVSKMGYSPKKLNTSTNTWDDPREIFVGSVDGSIRDGTGAGPDAPPVAKAATSYGRSASITYSSSPSWIAKQIHNGNPVVMFGAFRHGAGFISWKTPSGRIAKMNRSSHATLVVGVKGEPSSPVGFWVSDPLKSGVEYWTTSQVSNNIAQDADRQAVVIR